MSVKLDLYDVQGIITKAYGHYGYYKARYIFYRIHGGDDGRKFVKKVLHHVTTAVAWSVSGVDSEGNPLPKVTTNVAFNYQGLELL